MNPSTTTQIDKMPIEQRPYDAQWTAMPEFLTTKEVAVLLRCSVPTARELCHRPGFPVFKVGKNFRISKSALAEWAKGGAWL